MVSDSTSGSRPSTAAVILAAGRGRRFGRFKQFEEIDGETLVDRVVATASAVCDLVIVVLPVDHEIDDDGALRWDGRPVHAVVHGGETHGQSARIGLALVPDHVEVVVLASASHPLASADLYRRTVEAVAAGATAAAPAGPICDAIKEHDHGTVIGSVDKTSLVTAQAPCAFARRALVDAYSAFGGPDQPPLPPEELEMIERQGGRVVLVEGDPVNIHVTTATELEMARHLADLVNLRPAGSNRLR